MIHLLRNGGQVQHIYLFGSFLTGALSPNDVDLFVVMKRGFTTGGLNEPSLLVFTHETCRIRYTIDVFWVTEAMGDAQIEEMLEVFSRGRSQEPQGIVEVVDDPR